MRCLFKRLPSLLLCIILIAGTAQSVNASSLPAVGPGSVTVPAQTETAAETEEAGTVPDAAEAETTAALLETAETKTEETEAEEAPQIISENLPAGMTVEEYLAVKQAVMGDTAVDVYSANIAAAQSADSIEAGVLLAKRLKKLAQNSEFNAVIFRGSGYMRVRAEANTSSEVAGKLYYNAVATLLGTEYTESGLWYHIQSGKVSGYVKSEYMVSGAEAMDLLTEVVTTWVTPVNDAQRLYEEADTGSDTMAILTSDVKYKVMDSDEEFIKVLFGQTETGATVIGYVPVDTVTLSYEAQTAVSIEDENLSIAKSNEAYRDANSRAWSRAESSRQASIEASIRESSYLAYLASSRARAAYESSVAASRWASQQADANYQASINEILKQANQRNYSQYIPAGTSELRRAIVMDAIQYVGILDYVWGGESLTSGADCSGFVRAIFMRHGFNLAHYSKTLAVTGVQVLSISAARPGDLVCYHCAPSDPVGHVGIYIGNGLVVHSPQTGQKVKVNAADFMTIYNIRNVIGD